MDHFKKTAVFSSTILFIPERLKKVITSDGTFDKFTFYFFI